MKPKKLRGVNIPKHGVKEFYNWINARKVSKACDDFLISRGIPIEQHSVYILDKDKDTIIDTKDA